MEEPDSADVAPLRALLRQDAGVPGTMVESVEARVLARIEERAGLGLSHRLILACCVFVVLSLNGALALGPMVFVSLLLVSLYTALLEVEER